MATAAWIPPGEPQLRGPRKVCVCVCLCALVCVCVLSGTNLERYRPRQCTVLTCCAVCTEIAYAVLTCSAISLGHAGYRASVRCSDISGLERAYGVAVSAVLMTAIGLWHAGY
eukprot:437097-Rhodomonas_salina.1